MKACGKARFSLGLSTRHQQEKDLITMTKIFRLYLATNRLIIKIHLIQFQFQGRKNRPRHTHLQKNLLNKEKMMISTVDQPKCVAPRKTVDYLLRAQIGRIQTNSTLTDLNGKITILKAEIESIMTQQQQCLLETTITPRESNTTIKMKDSSKSLSRSTRVANKMHTKRDKLNLHRQFQSKQTILRTHQ